jgi:two-component system, CitB family, response regulator DctR
MADWQVLIVEDDQKVASIHRRIVNAQPGFQVSAIASSSEEAIAHFRRGVRFDLILLDISLPGADGTTLLRTLRANSSVEVIAITASREPKVVQTLLHFGVLDYLVKPFAVERLQQALLRFRDRMHALTPSGDLDQGGIDALYTHIDRKLLPKGLQPETLEAVRLALREAKAEFMSAEDLAQRASIARVTARRYLEYLISAQQVDMQLHHDGPGRPRKMYRLTDFSN